MNLGTWERVVVIGRGEGCQINVADQPESEYVSLQHAAILQNADGHVFVADLGSTNGTYVQYGNGPKVKVYGPTPIRPGCTIWVSRIPVPWTP